MTVYEVDRNGRFLVDENGNYITSEFPPKRADLVAVVRCKDCKHVCLCDAEEMFPDMPVYAKCTLTDETHEPDWFCADGEQKETIIAEVDEKFMGDL